MNEITLNDLQLEHVADGKIFNFKRYGTEMVVIKEVDC